LTRNLWRLAACTHCGQAAETPDQAQSDEEGEGHKIYLRIMRIFLDKYLKTVYCAKRCDGDEHHQDGRVIVDPGTYQKTISINQKTPLIPA